MDALNNALPQVALHLLYEGRDITRDISPALVRLRITDNLCDSCDDLDIELEDTQGRWRDAWYPGHGDTLELSLGWNGQDLIPMGRFEIDEVELNYPPATIHIRALAAGILPQLRTTQHCGYEKMTLEAIARQIAARQKLGFKGTVDPVRPERLTQNKADLEFLRELASQYDHAFKIWDNTLILQRIADLEAADPVAEFALTELANVRLRESFRELPKDVTVKHQDAAKGTLVEMVMRDGKVVAVPSSVNRATSSGDTNKGTPRATTAAQAKAQAAAKMAREQRQRCVASWQSMGQPELKSGVNVALSGESAGHFAGKWLITRITHSVERGSGFTSEVDACRVADSATDTAT